MKLLLIDNRVRSIEYITRSLEEDVDFIIFDYETETPDSLKSKIQIKPYESVGIVQDQDNIQSYTLMKSMGDYDLNDYSTWTTYKELLEWFTNLGIKFWDLIECNIDETWQPVIASLQTEFNIIIRSSSKQLGNTNLGDNWDFDNGTSLIGIYFTSAINDYPHTLGYAYSNITTFIDSDAKPWVRPDANNGNGSYGSLGLGNNNVNTSTNFFSIDLSNVIQVAQFENGQLFLKSDGTCYSCGYSYPNATGHATDATISSNTTPKYNKPTIIPFPSGTQPIKYITSSGYRSSFFLSTDSKLYVCGWNHNGELTTTNYGILILQKSLDNVYFVSSAFYATLIVLTTDKTKIYLYGEDIITFTNLNAPSPKSFTTIGSKEIKQIECGNISHYYVDVENNLYVYGRNNVGQLGVGDTTPKSVWTKVNGPSNVLDKNVSKVSSGTYTLQIITLTGDLYICGQYPWSTTAVYYSTLFNSTIHTSTPVKCEIGKKVVDVYSIHDKPGNLTNCYFRPTDGIYGKLTSLTTYSTLPKNTDSTALTTTAYDPYIYVPVPLNNCIQTFLEKNGNPYTRAFPGNKNVDTGILGQGNKTENVSGNFVSISLTECVQAEQVAGGQIFLKKDGTCYACGLNSKYNLGLPTLDTVYSTPTQITLSNKVKHITCGNFHTFFLMTNGDLYVCGTSSFGATTLNTALDAGSNQVTLCLTNVYLVSSLRDTTLIVFADRLNIIYLYGVDGRFTDWTNTSTTLGRNPNPKVLNTVNSKNISQIECGGTTFYYIDVDNNLYGTGYNNCGQLGNGTNVTSTSWVQISGPSSVLNNNVLTISSAYVTLQIITLTGDLYICGLYPWTNVIAAFTSSNFDNATTSTYYVNTPTLCMSGTKVNYIFSTIISYNATGGNNYVSCIFVDNNNQYKRLSSLTTTVYDSSIASIPPIVSTNEIISPQTSLSLLDSTSSIFVIGTNFYGTNVTLTNGYNKVTHASITSVKQVTNTSRGKLVLLQNGDVWAFGYNQYGELGTTMSSASDLTEKVSVKIFTGTIASIASGLHHSLLVTTTGTVYSCGLNNYGQLGQGNTMNSTPNVISTLSNISTCYCGLYSSYFLDNTGQLYACGYNFNTELGTNFLTAAVNLYYITPVQLTGICSNVATGDNHSLRIVGGIIYSTGLNNYGQLGLGNTNVFSGYQILTNNPTFTKVFAGENRSAGITSSDSLYVWGKNIGSTPVLTDINVTTVYEVSDIGIVYIKKNKYYVAYGTDILSLYTLKSPYTTNTIPNISLSPLTIYSNICFLEGTPVKCDQGLIEIDKIDPQVHTISLKKIVAITETYSTEKELVIIEKDSLRPNVPNQTTVITLEHKVFYKGKMIEASKLTKKRRKYNGEVLYNVLMEEHNKMSVNNMIVETLDPSNTIGKVFKGIREYRA